jgi:hypothetical protein
MIISKAKKFIFVHNPKVSGTTIRNQLEKYHDVDVQFWHQIFYTPEHRIIDLAHPMSSQFPYLFDKVGINPGDFTAFGFVRNPYTRFASALIEFTRRHSQEFAGIPIEHLLTEGNIAHDWRFIHFCPQHRFFANIGTVSTLIGYYESMPRDVEATTKALGIDIDLRINSRPSPPHRPLTEDQIRLVNRLYYKDFETFGYTMHDTSKDLQSYMDFYSYRVKALKDPSFGALVSIDTAPYSDREWLAVNQPTNI